MILARTPSSIASTSIVALSVSISANTSPDLTLSPTAFTHLAILPSVIVGDRAGIRISTGIFFPRVLRQAGLTVDGGLSGFLEDVSPQFRRVGLRAVLGELRGGRDDVLDLLVDRLERVLVGHVAVEQALLRLIDAIVLGAHAADLILGAVFGGVRHGVAAVAIGQHFEHIGTLARPRMLDGDIGRRLDRNDVHAVDLHAGNSIRLRADIEIMARRVTGERSAHAIAIVLDDVDDRQLPQRRHVEALVNLALVDGAVAEIGQADIAVVLVAVRKAEARADRYLGADDAVPAVEMLLAREHVHRAALAMRVAGAAAGERRHDTFWG